MTTVSHRLSAIGWSSALPFAVALGVYALLLAMAARLLGDADLYWHITIGTRILETGQFPHADSFSHTAAGSAWIAKEWLSQVVLAAAYEFGGWTLVASVAAVAAATAVGLLTLYLTDTLPAKPAVTLALAGFVLSAPHIVARPHVLAFPVMVAWVGLLVRAVDRKKIPSVALLPLIVLWANLHGSFTLGLALIVPLGVEAVWSAAPAMRRGVAIGWVRFAVLAALAACVTPYGPESMLVTQRVLGLDAALQIIGEWLPQDFSRIGGFELILLAAIGFAVYRGITLPPMRIVIMLGLLHMALAHVRHGEILGLLGPLFIAAPLAPQINRPASDTFDPVRSFAPAMLVLVTLASFLALGSARALAPVQPNPHNAPAAAVAEIKRVNAGPVFNDYDFGGYLISAGVAPFIDGRTELYGGAFTARHHRAVTLENLPDLLRLLDEYKIGATLLAPSRPAVALLDRLPGWRRLYADDIAVVHVRRADTPKDARPLNP